MLFSQFLSVSALVSVVLASPVSLPHVVHEKREAAPAGWIKRGELDVRSVLPMRIGLVQSNMDKAWDFLSEVSSPESAKFGQHWNAKQVAEAFAPSDITIKTVRDWLISNGIDASRMKLSISRGWIDFNATISEAEALLHTKYYAYEHAESEQMHVACDEYKIPTHLREHVDLIVPTLHFDAKIKPRREKRSLELSERSDIPDVGKQVGQPGSGSLPKAGNHKKMYPWEILNELKNCDTLIVPDCLRALYKFPTNFEANSKNSYGIVEYTPQAYLASDLDLFFRNFSKSQVGNRPILDSIDGGVVQTTNQGFNFNGESDLDLEYAMTLVYPQKVTLYQTGDLVEGASFNNLLDAIDKSYCTYEGGDDPTQDGIYPDPFGGFQGKTNCGGFSATRVISTSYSYNEHDLTPFYEMRQCNEYLKLGLMGVSVLYSSGDYGVAGNSNFCIDGPGQNASYNNGASGRFNPSFPSTCPYVTSVGATQVKPGTSIVRDLATGTQPEKACETVIYSGGGFSNVFPLPSYQKFAVRNWFKNFPPPYSAAQFNNSQQTRGFPDISANGANYVIAIDGAFNLVYGTSASSPTLGSILTLINQFRLERGKNSVGFINPTAYAHPWAFNDVTEGVNPGCGTNGFSASDDWDPLTGLGTPNFPKMLDVWLDLP